MFTDNYDSSFAFGYSKKVSIGEPFFFRNKYGLFHCFIFLTIKKCHCLTFPRGCSVWVKKPLRFPFMFLFMKSKGANFA